MSSVLTQWNRLSAADAAREVLACCGSSAWARDLAARRPFGNEAALVAASDEVWNGLAAADWMEAFSRHPRIGRRKAPAVASSQSAAWSAQEQKDVSAADESVQAALLAGNREYEKKFGRVFIVCATGKSAEEMLSILNERLRNSDATELRAAAEEQRKITNIRLKKWLGA